MATNDTRAELTEAQKQNAMFLKIISALLSGIFGILIFFGVKILNKIDDSAIQIQANTQRIAVQQVNQDIMQRQIEGMQKDITEIREFRAAFLGMYGLKPEEVKIRRGGRRAGN